MFKYKDLPSDRFSHPLSNIHIYIYYIFNPVESNHRDGPVGHKNSTFYMYFLCLTPLGCWYHYLVVCLWKGKTVSIWIILPRYVLDLCIHVMCVYYYVIMCMWLNVRVIPTNVFDQIITHNVHIVYVLQCIQAFI